MGRHFKKTPWRIFIIGLTSIIFTFFSVISNIQTLKFIGNKVDFRLDEKPTFQVQLPTIQNVYAGKENLSNHKKISVDVVHSSGQFPEIEPEIMALGNDKMKVTLSPKANQHIRPGKYHLTLGITEGSMTHNLEEDFSWGVLSINTNKSIFQPNETAQIQMAVLNEYGHTLCKTPLRLEITGPWFEKKVLSSEEGTITNAETCGADNVTDQPDYVTSYQVHGEGVYQMKLINLQNHYEITSSFEVKNRSAFEVERLGATRINPFKATYKMKFRIQSHEDFVGIVTESVPETFEITKKNGGTISADNKSKTLSWPVNFKAGTTEEIWYEYQAPKISPKVYFLGPLVVNPAASDQKSFQEARQWHIASDAGCTSGTGSISWGSAASWGAGCTGASGIPGTGDDVTIASGASMTYNVASLSINTLTFAAGTSPTTLTHSSTNALIITSVTTSVTLNQPTANNIAYTWNINGGSATLSGDLSVPGTDTTSTRTVSTNVTTGSMTIAGAVIYGSNATAATAVVQVTSSGTITINGAQTNTSGTLRVTGTGKLDFNNTVNTGGANGPIFGCGATGHIDFDNNFTRNSGGGTLNMPAGCLITFTNNATVTPTAAITFPDVTISGGTTTLAGNVIIASSFTNNSGTGAWAGAFTTSFSGSGKTIGGTFATTFNALTIGSGATITANTSFTVTNTLTFNATNATESLTLNDASVTATLNSVTMNQPTSTITCSFNVNAGTATVSGTYTFAASNTSSGRVGQITVTTGTISFNASTSIAFTSNITVGNQVIDLSGGAGKVNIAGSITNPSSATSTPGTTSTWVFNGTSAQTIPMGTASNTFWGACTTQCYAKLEIENTSAATLGNTVSSGNISDNLTVGDGSTAAIFNNGGFAIAGASGKTFTVSNSATFNMTGTSTYPTGFSTFTYGASSAENYKQTTNPLTITSATYGNLGLLPAGTATQNISAATYTVAGNLTVGDGTNAATVNLNAAAGTMTVSGNLTIAASSVLQANASTTLSVGGSWLTTGTFTHNSGTVAFTSTSTGKTINGGSSAFNNVSFTGSGGGWTATTNTFTVSGNLIVSAGNFDTGAVTNAITGTTSVTGTLTISSSTGTKTFSDDVTINSSGTWNETAAEDISFGGSLTNNQTFTASTGVHTFTGTTKSISGTVAIPNLTINVSVTNNNTLTVSTALAGAGTLTNGSGATLNIGGTSAITGLTATASTNTVNYTSTSAGQTIKSTTYVNLTIDKSGQTATLGGAIITNGTLTITNGTLDVSGSHFQITANGDWTNSGTFTAQHGTVLLSGSGQQTLSGTMTSGSAFYNLTITNSSGTDDPACGTSFTPGIIFAAAATSTNNYTITTASVRVQYKSGSTYTFNNINWNGQASGTKIFFRNSTLGSGTWLLNVSGTQTAVSFVNAGRSDASSGSLINATGGTSTDCSNNTNWAFGTLSVDIVDSGGTTVGSPSVSFSSLGFSYSSQTSTGTLSTSSQKIRVDNHSATATWTVAIAATSGTTALWTVGSLKYDYNDASGASDGADADAFGGQLTLDPSGGTVAAVAPCASTTGISKGSSNAYSESGGVSSITLLTAGGSASFNCQWDFTGISLSQAVPAAQAGGTYTLSFTITAA